MHSPMRSAMIMTTMLAMMSPLPAPKPEGYGVHLSKAERRGKSPAELQSLRAERMANA